MYLLAFYVPVEHADEVKQAMFAAGAGRIGSYDCCAWQTLGQGQFRPLAGSKPYLGSENEKEFVPELKVEMICQAPDLPPVIAALKAAHPYETPAFHAIKVDYY